MLGVPLASSTCSGHPRFKQEVGRRLAAGLRATVYAEKIQYYGPTYASAVAIEAPAGTITVSLHVEQG